MPLLQTAGGDAGQVVETAEGFLAVRWDFPQGTLSLALNVGNSTQPLPDLPGETLFAWPQAASELIPNAIVVRLAKREAE